MPMSCLVDYNSENMTKLRSARTAREISRTLSSISAVVEDIKVPKANKSVSNTTPIELSDMVKDDRKGSKLRKKLDSTIDLSQIDITDLKKKARVNTYVSDIHQAIAELIVAYQILSSKTFKAFKNQNEAASNLLKVIKEAKKMQQEMIKVLSINAEAPKEHTKIATSVANYVSNKILSKEQYTKIRMRTFVASGTNPATYQTYIYIENLTNVDQETFAHYSVVVSTTVELTTGEAKHYITTLVDEKMPGTFPLGKQATHLAEMKKNLNSLFAYDGMLNFATRAPINKGTTILRKQSALGLKSHKVRGKDVQMIDGIRVQNDRLYVRLVPGLSVQERKTAVEEVVAMAGSILRTKNQKKNGLVYKIIKGRQGREWVELSTVSGGTLKGTLTLEKVKRIAEELDLDESQIRAIKQAVK